MHYTYSITKKYPKDELYGAVSQHRRSALSIILNYIEGYSRKRKKVQLTFYEISYGSLGESRYLYDFALREKWIVETESALALKMADEIGAMLWSEIRSVEQDISKE